MATVTRFEDLRCWQQAKRLALEVYALTREGEFSRDFALRDQIRRAAGSVMHNVAEGFDAGSDAEFVRFLRYSLRSAAEVHSQLYLAVELGYLDHLRFKKVVEVLVETKNSLHGFIAYLVKSKKVKSLKEFPTEYLVEEEDFGDS